MILINLKNLLSQKTQPKKEKAMAFANPKGLLKEDKKLLIVLKAQYFQ